MESEKRKSILIVEDEHALSKAMHVMLESEGFEVVIAIDGNEAIESINSRTFDLILLDLIIPGHNGFEVLDHIRSTDKNTTVYVVSNLSHKEDEAEALRRGAQKFFVKSDISLEELAQNIREALNAP